MNKKITITKKSRRLSVSPSWALAECVTVTQESMDNGIIPNCWISVNAPKFDYFKIYDIVMCLLEAQRQAREWNLDAGKPAKDVLK